MKVIDKVLTKEALKDSLKNNRVIKNKFSK